MGICPPNAPHSSKIQIRLFLLIGIAVFGIVFGLLFAVYYLIFNFNMLFILFLIYFIIGLGVLSYVEKKTRMQEESND